MPTTLPGLLLLIATLFPGFVYVVVLQRSRPERRLSVFRETATVAFASVLFDFVAIGTFLIVRAILPGRTPDIELLVKTPADYISEKYVAVFCWFLMTLAFACVVAAGVALLVGLLAPHPSVVSSWWVLFNSLPDQLIKNVKKDGSKSAEEAKKNTELIARVACYLDDGSFIEGTVANFNSLADEVPDRDLILKAPIWMRTSDGTTQEVKSHVACISARDIKTMLVYYRSLPASVEPAEASDGGSESGSET